MFRWGMSWGNSVEDLLGQSGLLVGRPRGGSLRVKREHRFHQGHNSAFDRNHAKTSGKFDSPKLR